jgi:quinol monooxygenase YgiN
MSAMTRWTLFAVLACGVALLSRAATWEDEPKGPETVLATFRVKADQITAFLAMMPEYRKTLRAKDLVNAEPYVLLVGEEDGKPVVYEIFSWKDHHAADHVPPEIQTYWDRMNAMVERRGAHPGIEFPEVKLVSPVR